MFNRFIQKNKKMKNFFKILLSSGLALTLTSCGTMGETYGNNYPNQYPSNRYPQGGVYRAGDGTVYRQDEVYRDRNGNVYQNGRVVRTGDVYGRPGIISRSGNYPVYGNNTRNLPPGQAKKVYGGRATDYAKGQQKKRNVYYGNNDRRWNDNDRYDKRRDDDDDDRKYKNNKNWKNKKYKSYKKNRDRDDD